MRLVDGVKASAVFSPDRRYRYALVRDWFPKERGHVLWVMLNPSTATEDEDDRTVRRCQQFARDWGYDGITVCNLFAMCSRNPAHLYTDPDPVGPANLDVLDAYAAAAGVGLAVAAWGAHGALVPPDCDMPMGELVAKIINRHRELHVLGLTKHGHPRHPLYVKGDTVPVPWDG